MLLDTAVERGIPGVCAAVANRDTVIWTGAAGVSDVRSGLPVGTQMLFGIGSITKVFVATVILQLAEEGLLRLDEIAATLLGSVADGVPNVHTASIAQLLNHTSGIPSWEDDAGWIRDGRGATLRPTRVWGPADPLAYIRDRAPLAGAGEKFSYSNTNYTLLGLIIERVTSANAAPEIHKRIFSPLGLSEIRLEGFEPVPMHRLTRRYHFATPQFLAQAGVNPAFEEVRAGLIDVSAANLSVEWFAGGLLASMEDLARCGVALRECRLLTRRSMEFMEQWRPIGPGQSAGHGLFRTEGLRGPIVGHDGGVLGYSASLFWIEGTDATVAIACNGGSVHSGTVPAVAALFGRKQTLAELAIDMGDEA